MQIREIISHVKDENEFRRVESDRAGDNGQGNMVKLFISHCWRKKDTQIRKKELLAHMSGNHYLYWADYLDLQGEGARSGSLPWVPRE